MPTRSAAVEYQQRPRGSVLADLGYGADVPDETSRVEPFALRSDPGDLEDLRRRLRGTRWPDAPEDAGWSLGTDVAYLRELVAYWADEFDWPAQEAALNRLPHVRVDLDGLGIHAVHARAVDPSGPAMPLILSHGWPDSFWRYTKVLPLLTDPGAHGGDPKDAFDVVVPDVPGFGYSDRPAGPPLNSIAVAGLWGQLMTALGYQRFGASGGDIGSHVSRYLALDHPDRVVAVHRTDAGVPVLTGDPAELTAEERDWLRASPRGAPPRAPTARSTARSPRPPPSVSPIRRRGSPPGSSRSCAPGATAAVTSSASFSKDEILTNVTIYWLTGTIASSMRMYRANAAIPPEQLARRVEVPSGFSIFAGDVVRPPRAWLDRTANTVRATEPARGGHFAPFEEPELYAQELREFFRPYRSAVNG